MEIHDSDSESPFGIVHFLAALRIARSFHIRANVVAASTLFWMSELSIRRSSTSLSPFISVTLASCGTSSSECPARHKIPMQMLLSPRVCSTIARTTP